MYYSTFCAKKNETKKENMYLSNLFTNRVRSSEREKKKRRGSSNIKGSSFLNRFYLESSLIKKKIPFKKLESFRC